MIVFSCRVAESRLRDALMTWYQLHELQYNLQQIIAQEQHQLDCLDVATDIVSLSAVDVTDTISDLQVSSRLLCFCSAFYVERHSWLDV